jgi:NAD(P)-dependent dehydrogenase (short-subunit alcohol dehydrogenase family)
MSQAERPVVAVTEAGALGRAATAHLIARGWRVAIYHLPWMHTHAVSIRDAHEPQHVCLRQIDFGDWGSFSRASDAVRQEWGSAPAAALIAFDELQTDGPVHHARGAADTFARSATLNVDAVYRMLHVLLPPMVAAANGSIVVMGSRLAQRPWEGAGAAAFTATKAATSAMVQAVAQEVLESGVRINTILEGIVDEPGSRACVPHADHTRWVPMQSLVSVIGFLLSNEARDISGAAIPVYGRS